MKLEKNHWLSNAYLVFVFAVLYAPIFYLIYYSFNSGGGMNDFQSFTLEHYQAVLGDTRLIGIVIDTLVLALLSALCATIIGTLGAIMIDFIRSNRRKQFVLGMNNILLVSPDVIIGASLLILFTFIGFKLGFWSVLLSHIAFNIPIVVLMVLPKLTEMNRSMITAARDLGATSSQVLTRIILPSITPGILSGLFMAFTYSLDDFAVTFFVTGNGFSTIAVEIYSRARQGISLQINALSTLMFLFSLVLVIGYYFIQQYQVKRLNQKNAENDLVKGVAL